MIPKEITAFYNRYKTRLYNTSLRITGDSFDAEEIVQDTIIKYLRTNTGGMSEAQTSAWLVKACGGGPGGGLVAAVGQSPAESESAGDDRQDKAADAPDA